MTKYEQKTNICTLSPLPYSTYTKHKLILITVILSFSFTSTVVTYVAANDFAFLTLDDNQLGRFGLASFDIVAVELQDQLCS